MPAPTITELPVGKTPAERAIIKAEQLVARIGGHLPYDYSLGGLDISVLSVAVAPVTQRGVCWNTTGTPTTADSHTHDEP